MSKNYIIFFLFNKVGVSFISALIIISVVCIVVSIITWFIIRNLSIDHLGKILVSYGIICFILVGIIIKIIAPPINYISKSTQVKVVVQDIDKLSFVKYDSHEWMNIIINTNKIKKFQDSKNSPYVITEEIIPKVPETLPYNIKNAKEINKEKFYIIEEIHY